MRTQIVIPIAIATIIVLLPVTVFGECCTQPDNGTGTVDLPPEGCAYVSAAGDNWEMIDGLPPGTTIEGPGTHGEFFNVVRTPGGTLGGEIETFNSTLMLELYGTGELDGFHRTIFMEVACEVHTGPRNPGDPVQTFSSNMINFYGVISGDPDFDFLIVRAGSNFGLPSPGETTLTQLPSGDFAVDSFFDITYEIDFVGAPGSALDGFVGTTASTVWMEIVFDCYNCTAPDNGSSTIDFPAACPYDNGAENIVVSEGLVPGDTLILDGPLTNFTSIDHKSGSASGGETVFFDAEFPFAVSGTGNLTGYTRNITIPVICEVHTGPRNPGDPVQTFTNDMFRLSGGIVGDPDFDSLSIMAGTGNGLPSPGKTVLKEELPSGDFPADSFFDITYQIEFTGAPGSIFDGLSGTTTGEIRLYTGFECNTYLNEVIDAWATSESRVEFGSPEFSVIPAGFFGPGSDPFEG
ncbi:MAG: hypothetical protein JW912_07865, partial [Sedimentisphaerales bacterium]|nr:hypothetical protein [Sedimentisphaerales bacterium]